MTDSSMKSGVNVNSAAELFVQSTYRCTFIRAWSELNGLEQLFCGEISVKRRSHREFDQIRQVELLNYRVQDLWSKRVQVCGIVKLLQQR